MSKENKDVDVKTPFVNFKELFDCAKYGSVERSIIAILQEYSSKVSSGQNFPMGAIVVLGDFYSQPVVSGMVQMKPNENPVKRFITVYDEESYDLLVEFSKPPYDGAVVVDRSGQIIGAGIYLVVDNPIIKTPPDCGTRHKAAASFSLRKDVQCVVTLSEETNTVRVWRDGRDFPAH